MLKKSILTFSFISISLLFLYSCSSENSKTEVDQNDILLENLPPIDNSAVNTDGFETFDFGKYPFGCPTLVRFAFSDEWNIIDFSGTVNMGHSIYQKALLEINECLQDINHSVTIERPKINKSEKVSYFKEADLTCNDAGAIDSALVSLPDIGPYNAYYAFGNFYGLNPPETLFTPDDCLEYGNLVLVDPKTNNAKVLNLYSVKEREQNIYLRLFYIDENKLIHIKEIFCDQKYCKITKRYSVKVENNGQIKVELEK